MRSLRCTCACWPRPRRRRGRDGDPPRSPARAVADRPGLKARASARPESADPDEEHLTQVLLLIQLTRVRTGEGGLDRRGQLWWRNPAWVYLGNAASISRPVTKAQADPQRMNHGARGAGHLNAVHRHAPPPSSDLRAGSTDGTTLRRRHHVAEGRLGVDLAMPVALQDDEPPAPTRVRHRACGASRPWSGWRRRVRQSEWATCCPVRTGEGVPSLGWRPNTRERRLCRPWAWKTR